ncbi:SET domain-containing protein [Candidatus Saccharibacteria bacterium]|nr:SET domain-containing protein [Candidatus Saccharibacteria bacterium]
MYIVKIKVDKSEIDGRGVFASERIKKGKTVWVYDPEHDLSFDQEEFDRLDSDEKERLHHSAYLSPWTGLRISPPAGDPANYTNHSTENNLSVRYDKSVSPELYFVANRDIEVGEELTNNYHEFDEITRKTKPGWAKEVDAN